MFGVAYLLGRRQRSTRYSKLRSSSASSTQVQPRGITARRMPNKGPEASSETVDSAVVDTVKAVKAVLEVSDEEKANDAEEITNYIKDASNHIAIRNEIDAPMVEEVLRKVSSEETAPYVAPEGTFPRAQILKGKPLSNMTLLEKQEFVGIHHAPGGVGSKGTYIVACKSASSSDIQLVVMKELTLNSPSEVFASVLMRCMGLRAPNMRILSSDEFKNLSMKLRNALQSEEGTCNVLFDATTLSSGMLVMEFMPGKTLADASDADLKLFRSATVLKEIGQCMAVDMSINCLDRIPIVWSNSGNATNLMLNGDHIAVIDSAYNRVLVESAADEKAANVRACIEELMKGERGESTMRVWDFFNAATNGRLVISDEEMNLMMQAVLQTCQKLANEHQQIFTEAGNETRKMFDRYLANGGGIVTQQQVDECLDLSFCIKCAMQMDSSAIKH